MPKKATRPVPEGMRTITPSLSFKGNCKEAIEFYKKALGATLVGDAEKTPDGKVLHAMLKVGDSNLLLSDMFCGEGTAGDMMHLWVYVDDADTSFTRAVSAGCEITMPIEDAFWGDRLGQVRDPYGFMWSIASAKWDLTPQEMQQAEEEWLHAMEKR